MKFKIFTFSIIIALGVSANAQDAPSKSDFREGQLVAMSGDNNEYFIDNQTFLKDESGLASGNVLSFFENGNLKESGKMLKDKRHGTWKKYSDSGQIINEAHYINGNKDGVWKVWDENGMLRLEFQYNNGQRTGTWLMFDAEGNLTTSETY